MNTRSQIANAVRNMLDAQLMIYEDALEESRGDARDYREVATSCEAEKKRLTAACAALKTDAADYERTVAGLREQLRAEEERRAHYQRVHGLAIRFVRGCTWSPEGPNAKITAPDDDVWRGLRDAV